MKREATPNQASLQFKKKKHHINLTEWINHHVPNLCKTTYFLIYFDNFGKNKLFPWISISPVAMFSNPASRLPTKVSKTQSGSLIILIKMDSHGLHWINYRIHWVAFFNLCRSSFIHLFNQYLSLHSNHTKMLNITCTMWYTSFVPYPISPTGNVFTLFIWQKKILIHTKMKFTHFAP